MTEQYYWYKSFCNFTVQTKSSSGQITCVVSNEKSKECAKYICAKIFYNDFFVRSQGLQIFLQLEFMTQEAVLKT